MAIQWIKFQTYHQQFSDKTSRLVGSAASLAGLFDGSRWLMAWLLAARCFFFLSFSSFSFLLRFLLSLFFFFFTFFFFFFFKKHECIELYFSVLTLLKKHIFSKVFSRFFAFFLTSIFRCIYLL